MIWNVVEERRMAERRVEANNISMYPPDWEVVTRVEQQLRLQRLQDVSRSEALRHIVRVYDLLARGQVHLAVEQAGVPGEGA